MTVWWNWILSYGFIWQKTPYRYFVWQKYYQKVPGAPLSTAVLSLPLHSGGKWGITSQWLLSFKLKEPQRSVCLMELVDCEMFHTSNQEIYCNKLMTSSAKSCIQKWNFKLKLSLFFLVWPWLAVAGFLQTIVHSKREIRIPTYFKARDPSQG